MTASRRGRSKILGWTAIFAVVAFAGTEIATRIHTSGRIADSVHSRFDAEYVGAGLGLSPVVPQVISGELDHVHLDLDDMTFGPVDDVGVAADLRDVSRQEESVVASEATARAEVPADGLAAAASGWLPDGVRNVMIVPHPETNQLELQAGPAGVVTADLTPYISGSMIMVEVGPATVAGRPMAPRHGDASVEVEIADLSGLPLDLAPVDLTVTDDGVAVDLASPRSELS